MKTRRAYTMTARAEAKEATRTRILEATMDATLTTPLVDLTLDAIAASAGVSVQTLLRHFGSRDGLLDAGADFGRARVAEERRAPVGDSAAAVHVIVDHYERRGDGVLLMLAQETTQPLMAAIVTQGRALHRRWVQDVWADHLARLTPSGQDRLTNLLVVGTDVYTWKLLRRDRGLSRTATEEQLLHLLTAVLTASTES